MEAARALKQQGIIEDDRFWPIPDMAQGMRVEHDRLVQLGWVYDGFGGYRKKAASSHPGPKLAASNALDVSASVLRRRGYRVCNSTGRRTPKSRRGDDGNGAQISFSFFNDNRPRYSIPGLQEPNRRKVPSSTRSKRTEFQSD